MYDYKRKIEKGFQYLGISVIRCRWAILLILSRIPEPVFYPGWQACHRCHQNAGGLGLTAPIHFLVVYYKYQKRVGKFRGIIATMKHSGFPISMTSFTTVAGLLSFSFSDIAPIAGLVNFTIIGILAILVFTLVTMPAFLSILQVVEGAEQGEANYEASIYNRTLLALGRLGVTRPCLVSTTSVVLSLSPCENTLMPTYASVV